MSLFITVDGPNGVGKTTLINNLCNRLQHHYSIYSTREPSDDPFGIYVKNNEHSIRGLAYAYLISANRAYHCSEIIKPALSNYDIVICDRYIGSSLALQSYDGVDIDSIWEINQRFIMPDLSIFLLANEDEISKRLSERDMLSFFERKMTRLEETCYYTGAYQYMTKQGIATVLFDNSAAHFNDNIIQAENMILDLERGI